MELLQKAVPILTLVLVVSSMLAVGLGLTVGQIIAPLRNRRLVAMSLLVNFVLMPLIALALAKVLRLDEPLRAGMLLLGAAAGAPFLPKLVEIAKGDLAFSAGLMVLLMVVTVGYLPLVLPILLPGVSVNPAKIAQSLFVSMLLPLAAALTLKARLPAAAARAKPPLEKISSLSVMLVIVLVVVLNFRGMLSVIGTGGILAAFLFVAAGYGLGWLLGGPAADTRLGLGIGTAQRNIPAALVVGGQSFTDPRVVLMLVVGAIVTLVVLLPLSRMQRKRS